ncbi:NYN domain-containing protein, partial [Schizophyllum commune]
MFGSSEKVAVFWDYGEVQVCPLDGRVPTHIGLENCAPPAQVSGYDVVDTIRGIGHRYGAICQLKAYLEPPRQYVDPSGTARLLALRTELQASGVSLTDCPHNGMKEVADHMMQVDMLAFALDHPAPATVILITGDRDFAYATAVLRARRYRVIILSLPHIHETLKAQADEWLEWGPAVRATEERRRARTAGSSAFSEPAEVPRSTVKGRATRASSLSSVTSSVSALSSLSLSPPSFPVSDDRDLSTPPSSPPSLTTSPASTSQAPDAYDSDVTLANVSPPSTQSVEGGGPAIRKPTDVHQFAKTLLACTPPNLRFDFLRVSPQLMSPVARPLSPIVTPATATISGSAAYAHLQPAVAAATPEAPIALAAPVYEAPPIVVPAPTTVSIAPAPAPSEEIAARPPVIDQPPVAASLPTPPPSTAPTAQNTPQASDSSPAQMKIVPQNYAALVSILQDQRRLGKTQFSRIELARLLNMKDVQHGLPSHKGLRLQAVPCPSGERRVCGSRGNSQHIFGLGRTERGMANDILSGLADWEGEQPVRVLAPRGPPAWRYLGDT